MLWMPAPQPMQSPTSKAVKMRNSLILLVGLSVVQSVAGCSLTRPDQENYLVDASGIGGAALARELSSRLGTNLKATQITLPDSDPAKVYRLDGRGFTLVFAPLPDDRCNPNASYHSTYKEQQFGIDLVYTTSSSATREAAKRKLLAALEKLRVPVEKFSECPQ